MGDNKKYRCGIYIYMMVCISFIYIYIYIYAALAENLTDVLFYCLPIRVVTKPDSFKSRLLKFHVAKLSTSKSDNHNLKGMVPTT